jgi:hypothetical protein
VWKNCQGYFYANCSCLTCSKTTLWKNFTHRIIRSAIRLFVLDFSWDDKIFAWTIR